MPVGLRVYQPSCPLSSAALMLTFGLFYTHMCLPYLEYRTATHRTNMMLVSSVKAAHCLHDEHLKKLRDLRNFKVTVGKETTDWDVIDPGEQRSSVRNGIAREPWF